MRNQSEILSTTFVTPSARWAALVSRNPLADGAFVYCVKTTRIYCRPICAARLARRANIVFCHTPAEAEAAGFRACKRCKPDLLKYDPQEDFVARACREIETNSTNLGLKDLAGRAGLTKSHFHRVFKRVMGVTPKAYGELARAGRVIEQNESPKEGVDMIPAVDDINITGFSTPESLEDVLDSVSRIEGPGDRATRSGSTRSFSVQNIEYTLQSWSSGFVLIAATLEGICFLDAGDSEDELILSMIHHFPTAKFTLSTWGFDTRPNRTHALFSTIMEAVVQPSGKIMNVPFDSIYHSR